MGFFRKKDTVEGGAYFSQRVVNDGDDCSAFDCAVKDNATDDDDCDFEIVFFEELSNGALVFKLIDDDGEQAGHVVVSSKGTATVLENTLFYTVDDDDRKYLKDQAENFYTATR